MGASTGWAKKKDDHKRPRPTPTTTRPVRNRPPTTARHEAVIIPVPRRTTTTFDNYVPPPLPSTYTIPYFTTTTMTTTPPRIIHLAGGGPPRAHAFRITDWLLIAFLATVSLGCFASVYVVRRWRRYLRQALRSVSARTPEYARPGKAR